MGSLGSHRRWSLAVAALTVAGFALRVWAARRESIFLDEVSLGWLVSDRSFSATRGLVEELENTPILGFLLSWIAAKASSAPEAIRTPSVIAGTLTIPVAAILASRCFGWVAGLGAAALVAASPFLNFFSVEARPYALACLFSTVAVLATVEGSRDGARRIWWAAWALAAALAMLSHYTAVFPILVMVVWAAACRPTARRPLAVAAAAAGALFALAWWGPFAEQLGHSDQQVQFMKFLAPVTVGQFARIVATGVAGRPIVPLGDVPGIGLGIAIALLTVGSLVAGVAVLLRDRKGGGSGQGTAAAAVASAVRSDGGLVALIATAPPVMLVAASVASGGSFMLARNAIAAVPCFLVLVAAGPSRLGPRAAGTVTGALAALLFAVTLAGTVDWPRPLMREAADRIAADWKPGDVILEQTFSQQPLNDADLAPYLPAKAAGSITIARVPRRAEALALSAQAFERAAKAKATVYVITPTGSGTAPATPPRGSRMTLLWTKRYGGAGPLVVTAWRSKESLRKPPEPGPEFVCHGGGAPRGGEVEYRSDGDTMVGAPGTPTQAASPSADSGICPKQSASRR